MIELNVIRNKANGQIFINIPKSIAGLHKIDESVKVILEHKGKDEFVLKIKR